MTCGPSCETRTADDAALRERIAGIWHARTDRYSELRTEATTGLPKVEMFAIGG